MSRRALVGLFLVLLVVGGGVFAVWWERQPSPTAGPSVGPTAPPTRTSTPAPTPVRTTAPTTAPQPAGVPKRPKAAQPMTVRYVYDGDTLQLQASKPGRHVTSEAKIRVRLIGVNAPEMTPKKECYAQQATDRLRALATPGTRVWVAPDRDSWDDYRRRLFLVWDDSGRLLDHALVSGGYGTAIRVYPNVTYWPVFQRAEAQARKAKKGLWGAC